MANKKIRETFSLSYFLLINHGRIRALKQYALYRYGHNQGDPWLGKPHPAAWQLEPPRPM
jgi:hypothetical protein